MIYIILLNIYLKMCKSVIYVVIGTSFALVYLFGMFQYLNLKNTMERDKNITHVPMNNYIQCYSKSMNNGLEIIGMHCGYSVLNKDDIPKCIVNFHRNIKSVKVNPLSYLSYTSNYYISNYYKYKDNTLNITCTCDTWSSWSTHCSTSNRDYIVELF